MNYRTGRYLNILALLCFFLPFFPSGCGPSAGEKRKAEEQRAKDSMERARQFMDSSSLKPDTSAISIMPPDPAIIDQSSQPASADKKTVSEEVAEQLPWLNPVLTPGGNRSGIGYVVDGIIFYIYFFGTLNVFMMLLLNLLIRSVEKLKQPNLSLLLSFLSVISLYFTNTVEIFPGEKLWGYWVCFVVLTLMLVGDIRYSFFSAKKSPA